MSVTQPWLLSVLAASTFPLIPGGSAIPLAFAGSAMPLSPSSLTSAGSVIPLPPSPLSLAEGAGEQAAFCFSSNPGAALGRWPHWTPLTKSFVSPYTCSHISLSHQAGPALFLGPNEPMSPLQVLLEMPIVIFILCQVINPTDLYIQSPHQSEY